MLEFQPLWFNPLYHAISKNTPEKLWADVLVPNEEWFLQQRDALDRKQGGWSTDAAGIPILDEGDLYVYFAISVVNNALLTSFQESPEDSPASPAAELEPSQYRHVWSDWLGFELREVTRFHPFHCEIVEVVEAPEGQPLEILETKWPCLMRGSLLFSRAGVVVRAPRSAGLHRGVADRSTLYFTDWRLYRPTNCQSHGWGHNSMWRTRFRCDFELPDVFVYNHLPATDPQRMELHGSGRSREGDTVDEDLAGMTQEERVSFVRHRCLIASREGLHDGYPYNITDRETR